MYEKMAKHCVKIADAVLKELLNSEFETEWTVVLGAESFGCIVYRYKELESGEDSDLGN